MARRGFKRCPRGTQTQTVLLPKDSFRTEAKAVAWLKENDLEHDWIESGGSRSEYWRARQAPPSHFVKGSFRTMDLPGSTTGVRIVVGCPLPAHAKNPALAGSFAVDYWECAYCGTQNVGGQRTCSKCHRIERANPPGEPAHAKNPARPASRRRVIEPSESTRQSAIRAARTAYEMDEIDQGGNRRSIKIGDGANVMHIPERDGYRVEAWVFVREQELGEEEEYEEDEEHEEDEG